MSKIVVVDLDGTLANIDHRLHLIKSNEPDWDAFFNACAKDKPNDWCVELIAAMLEMGHRVLVVSARSKVSSSITDDWFREHVPAGADLILLREAGNTVPDIQLKSEWLKGFKDKDKIIFVVDDRQRVVDMWRANGLVCLQCYSWEEWKK